ncbi:MAG: hypothetical protein WHV26_11660 [Spirochaetota bacterium]
MGKPLPIQSVQMLYNDFPGNDYARLNDTIQWLVDSNQRLNEYLNFARNVFFTGQSKGML